MHLRLSQYALLLLCAWLVPGSPAQLPDLAPPVAQTPLRDVSTAEYRAHLDALRALVADCGRVITACDPAAVGGDDRVHPAQGAPYTERYGWLRSLLDPHSPATFKLREQLLPHAEQRLSEQEAELDSPFPVAPLRPEERAARDAVLAAKEFQTVREYSLRERIAAWISDKLSRMFGGAAALGRMAPWLGTSLEWGSLMLVAALLVLWIYRSLDRQRQALGKLQGSAIRDAAEAESRAWADLATSHAAHGEWRDAVHCMYWATIVLLEDRRTLRRNPARTPREALALIDSKSQALDPLRAQTRAFERIWYGKAPAEETDYAEANIHYVQVKGSLRKVAA